VPTFSMLLLKTNDLRTSLLLIAKDRLSAWAREAMVHSALDGGQ